MFGESYKQLPKEKQRMVDANLAAYRRAKELPYPHPTGPYLGEVPNVQS